MAASNFKLAQSTLIYQYVDQLIRHVSELDPSQTNYRIAEEFVMSNIEAHTFPDTNDNDIKRQFKNLKDKLLVHNQFDKVQRLDYLMQSFLKRKLKNTGGGFGEVHYSVVRLLYLLQNCPTEVENIDQFKNSRVYLTKEEIQAQLDKQMEEQLKIKTEEDDVIQGIKEEWEQELATSDNDEDDSDFDDEEEGSATDQQNIQEAKTKSQDKQIQGIRNQEGSVQYQIKGGKEIEEQQMFFGGMPFSKMKAPPIIKTKVKPPKQQKPKKFSINAFLEKYLNELKPQTLPYEKYLDQKKRDEALKEKEKQQKLKILLNIRTFDELQRQLSVRTSSQDFINPSINQPSASNQNHTLSSYIEPLNLLNDYAGKQQQDLGFWHHDTVTERQLVVDTIMLMQQLETPTYRLSKKTGENGNIGKQMYEISHKIQMKHVTPKMLENVITKFLNMGNIIRETLMYLKGLKVQKDRLGMVFESFTYKIEQILERFNCEMIDLQQIAMLQAGQLSKKQLTLSPLENSLVSKILNIDEPLTLLRLHLLLESALFRKMKLIHDIMRNGVMDYLIIEDDQNLMVQEINHSLLDSEHFEQNASNRVDPNVPEIQVDKIKAADRVTFLLNYLYLVIKNNQLLTNFTEINILKEIFTATLLPYISIMADWVNKGELKDPQQEFFIKANPKVFDNQEKASSKDQWKESFIFRTINLKELMGQGQQILPPENQKVEISIPIFLRPILSEILSIGKSIKIVRYLDKINIVKDGYDDFQDFKAIYQAKVDQELEIIKQKDDQFNYFDEEHYQPNSSLIECANQNLNNIWDPSYTIGNIMNESQNLKNYRDLLQVAPFQWSIVGDSESNNQGVGIFQIPQIQKNLNNSFASTQLSDNTPEKNINADHQMLEIESISPVDDQPIKKQLLDEEKYLKLSNSYNFSYQELMNYEDSMNYYQASQPFEYLMRNPLDHNDLELQKKQDLRIYNFKRFSIENFIKECLTTPMRSVYSKTCARFFKRLNAQCKLKENIRILRQIFFMEAGHQMHQYATQIFKQMDKGRSIENLYMINGHFNESVCQNLKGVDFIEKMSVVFSQDPKAFSIQSINALDYISLQFQSEWPLEIILDKETIKQYNLILSQLMKIKE